MTVTLASGDILCLGFNQDAHETAATINSTTKEQLTDLQLKHQNTSTSTSPADVVNDESHQYIILSLK